jgi:hypothetical protein
MLLFLLAANKDIPATSRVYKPKSRYSRHTKPTLAKMVRSQIFIIDRIGQQLNTVQLRGYGDIERRAFFKAVAMYAKQGKMYQLALVEVTASEAQKNFMWLIINVAAKSLGYSPSEFRLFMEQLVFECAMNSQDDYFERTEWVDDVVNLETGELVKSQLKSPRLWKTGMCSDFTNFVTAYANNKSETPIKFPDPTDFKGEAKGEKNLVSDNYMTIKIEI